MTPPHDQAAGTDEKPPSSLSQLRAILSSNGGEGNGDTRNSRSATKFTSKRRRFGAGAGVGVEDRPDEHDRDAADDADFADEGAPAGPREAGAGERPAGDGRSNGDLEGDHSDVLTPADVLAFAGPDREGVADSDVVRAEDGNGTTTSTALTDDARLDARRGAPLEPRGPTGAVDLELEPDETKADLPTIVRPRHLRDRRYQRRFGVAPFIRPSARRSRRRRRRDYRKVGSPGTELEFAL